MELRFAYSAGSGMADVSVPAGACDCHMHVYDARVPAVPGTLLRPPDASIAQYRQVQQRMGTTRAVVVTPSTYGTDNTLLLDALAQLGPQGRGVAVISGQESDEQLQQLHAQGVRGVRVNLSQGVSHTGASLAPLASRIAALGWHLQLLMAPDQLAECAPVLDGLPVPLVFDHFGRIAPALAGHHAAHAWLLRWLGQGRAWVKLSGGYLVSPLASVDDPALDALARTYLDAAPERVLWGSDWPHATASAGHQPMPDDARQMERLAQWAGSAQQLHRLLVTNPEQLYGFAPSSAHTS